MNHYARIVALACLPAWLIGCGGGGDGKSAFDSSMTLGTTSMDAIVMVSSYPRNSIYVFDMVTGTESELDLSKLPTSVSVSPDGLAAAVGHDALVSYVDLTTVGAVDAPTPVLLGLSTLAHDLILDGRGFIHALPATDQWVKVHSIEIATNTERLSERLIYAGALGKLHPSGDFLYTVSTGLWPGDIEKHDITTGVAVLLHDSPYHKEIMVIERDRYYCEILQWMESCRTHVGVYESDFLNRTAVYSVPPLTIGDKAHVQQGKFVFHNANGLHRYMISAVPDTPTFPHYISMLQ